MNSFDELLQGQPEQTEEQKRKDVYAKLQAERKQICFDLIGKASREIIGNADAMQKFLSVMSRFEVYSLNNNLLIYMQKPEAVRLKEYKAWQKELPEGSQVVKQGGKSLMILEPNKYHGKDGNEHISFNAKLMYDRSDIVNAEHEPKVSHDMRQLLMALISDCVVPIVIMREGYPADAPLGAMYDAEQQKIFAKGGMRPEEIFSSVAVAISHSEMDRAIRKTTERNHTQPIPYRTGDHEFQARCASYVLCMKYGVSTDAVSINSVPPRYAGMETDEIRKDLSAIHESVKEVSRRMERILHPPEKKQNREER